MNMPDPEFAHEPTHAPTNWPPHLPEPIEGMVHVPGHGYIAAPKQPPSELHIVNRALLKMGGHENREPRYEVPSKFIEALKYNQALKEHELADDEAPFAMTPLNRNVMTPYEGWRFIFDEHGTAHHVPNSKTLTAMSEAYYKGSGETVQLHVIVQLYNEVDCRIEHGATDGIKHLEYVRMALKRILDEA